MGLADRGSLPSQGEPTGVPDSGLLAAGRTPFPLVMDTDNRNKVLQAPTDQWGEDPSQTVIGKMAASRHP